MRAGRAGIGLVAAGLAALLALLLLSAAGDDAAPPSAGVDETKIPALARDMLPMINELVSRQCPELPPLWVIAEVQAESGWNPRAFSADYNGDAAGLYQMNQRNWIASGGAPWASTPPPAGADVVTPEAHLRIAIPWVCANVRAAATHLAAAGKPTKALDGMLVCHIAGCGRMTGSATGVPRAGEANCDERCAGLVARYLATVHRYVEAWAAPAGTPGSPRGPAVGGGPVPNTYTGPATGCTVPDPTGDGCLTATTQHGFLALQAAFGPFRGGPVIKSAGCWDKHAWNPRSDHSRGRACDLFPGKAGNFVKGPELDAGWRMANWLRTYADRLHVRYLIWQGRYWDRRTKDTDGEWGQRYTGGGVYNVRDATGGHFDHVHVSFTD